MKKNIFKIISGIIFSLISLCIIIRLAHLFYFDYHYLEKVIIYTILIVFPIVNLILIILMNKLLSSNYRFESKIYYFCFIAAAIGSLMGVYVIEEKTNIAGNLFPLFLIFVFSLVISIISYVILKKITSPKILKLILSSICIILLISGIILQYTGITDRKINMILENKSYKTEKYRKIIFQTYVFSIVEISGEILPGYRMKFEYGGSWSTRVIIIGGVPIRLYGGGDIGWE